MSILKWSFRGAIRVWAYDHAIEGVPEEPGMTVQTIRFEVTRLLADANHHLHEVEEALAHGEGRVRINAAGELVSLRRRKEALRSEEHTSELQSPCNLVC